ncbi:NTP transferase domain-containing protein, partial [Bacillus cereus group sp. Bce019]|uniref:NTP transferase domain-containing protein n=1 Tax=Bacillus cereus group sp. Bce019 TaxID=3445247 RepID=UPI003F214D5D
MNTDPGPVVALVVAPGSGSRLGAALPKALGRVGDRTLVEHSVRAMVDGGCGAVYVVVGEGMDTAFTAALAQAPVACRL